MNPRRQTKRDARKYVEQATGRSVGWKAARKWLKRAANFDRRCAHLAEANDYMPPAC